MGQTVTSSDRSTIVGELLRLLQADEPAIPLAERLAEFLECRLWEGLALEDYHAKLQDCLGAKGLSIQDVLAEMSDEALARCIQKGDLLDLTFEQLFVQRYMTYISRWLLRWGAHADDVEDIVQELVTRFYETRLRDFDAARNFRAYLRQCTHHLWVQQLRKRRPREHLLFPEIIAGPEPTPVVNVIQKELDTKLHDAIARLGAEERQVLVRALEGEKPGAIAEALHQPMSRVYRLLFNARRRIERELAPLVRLPRRGGEA
jgi:RNA polymerase sigma factor (sigma-70 family)